MIVIPALDLKEGRCVRLSQGRMDRESVYSEDPIQMAKHWESEGAERLHVVDLNGAVSGAPYHRSLVEEIIRSVHIPVQVGGGIRELETIEHYLSCGAGWVILGTAAVRNRPLVEDACRRFQGRMILSIDSKKGKVATEGWKDVGSLEAVDIAKQFEGIPLSAIIFTDIERDGMETGLSGEMIRRLARDSSFPIIAAGGVSRIEDIERLIPLEEEGVVGVIVGRALYTGHVDLKEAIGITRASSLSPPSLSPPGRGRG